MKPEPTPRRITLWQDVLVFLCVILPALVILFLMAVAFGLLWGAL